MADGRALVYGSICSGIEAATVAWHPLGWRPAWFAEIDTFPSAVLAHHYPEVPNFGDFTKINREQSGPIDLLVGGTPCQSFSVAGKRAGLDDPRGNLTLEFLALAERVLPRWLVWENVPGVLSDDGGRTFGTVLGLLGQLGYGFAYRVLDAQYFGVPQRRRRVFVVGCLGNWRASAAVLFERESLLGNPAPSREAGQDVTRATSARTKGGGGLGTDFDCDGGLIAGPLCSGYSPNGHGIAGVNDQAVASNHVVPVWLNGRQDPITGEQCGPLDCDPATNAVAFNLRGREDGAQAEPDELASLRAASGGSSRSYVAFDETQITHPANRSNPQPDGPAALAAAARPPTIAGACVRRLTPRECERLQGFPDDYTLIPYRGKPAADGPRYKALGNSMAVPVMRWIGQRIQQVEQITEGGTRHDG